MKWKKTLIFILFLLTGIVLGTLLTSLCSSVSFLNWLTIGEQIGIGVPNPIVLDIGVMTLSFGVRCQHQYRENAVHPALSGAV